MEAQKTLAKVRRTLQNFAFLALTFSISTVAFAAEPNAPTQKLTTWEKAELKAEKAFIDHKLEDADKLWKDALVEAEKSGAESAEVATTLNQMNHLFMQQKRFHEAESALTRALNIRKSLLGEETLPTAETMGNLALVKHKLGEDEEAEKLLLHVLAIKEKLLGKDAKEAAITLVNLANLYADHKRCKEAEKYYQEAVRIDAINYGEKSKTTISDRSHLAVLFYHCGDIEKSLDELTTVLKEQEVLFGLENPELVPTLHYIGLCNVRLKRQRQAHVAYARALEIQEKARGRKDQETIFHLLHVAKSYDALNDRQTATKLYEEAAAAEEARTQKSDYRTTECYLEIAHFYKRHKEHAKAEKYFKMALQSFETLNRHEQRKLYELPVAYADMLKELKRAEESAEMSKKYLHVHFHHQHGGPSATK